MSGLPRSKTCPRLKTVPVDGFCPSDFNQFTSAVDGVTQCCRKGRAVPRRRQPAKRKNKTPTKEQLRKHYCPHLVTAPNKRGKCPKGYKAEGSKRDASYTCCRAVSIFGKLKKDELKKYGYSTKVGVAKRRAALKKAVRAYGEPNVAHKLTAVMVLNSNTNPKASKVFKDDLDWVKVNFGKRSGVVPMDISPVKKESRRSMRSRRSSVIPMDISPVKLESSRRSWRSCKRS